LSNEPLLPNEEQEDHGAENQVHATFCVRIGVKKRKEARLILGTMITQTQFAEGCISCRLYQDVQTRGVFMLKEIWTSEHSLYRHLQSENFRKVLLVIEMAVEAPEIRFDQILRSTGISTIKKARSRLGL